MVVRSVLDPCETRAPGRAKGASRDLARAKGDASPEARGKRGSPEASTSGAFEGQRGCRPRKMCRQKGEGGVGGQGEEKACGFARFARFSSIAVRRPSLALRDKVGKRCHLASATSWRPEDSRSFQEKRGLHQRCNAIVTTNPRECTASSFFESPNHGSLTSPLHPPPTPKRPPPTLELCHYR